MIEPLGLDKIPVKSEIENIPKQLDEVKLENLKGIQETVDLLKFLASLGNAVKASLEDGAFSLPDVTNFIGTIKNSFSAFSGIAEVPSELSDEITEEEKLELKKVIIEAGVGNVEEATMEGLDLAIALKNYIFKHFVNA